MDKDIRSLLYETLLETLPGEVHDFPSAKAGCDTLQACCVDRPRSWSIDIQLALYHKKLYNHGLRNIYEISKFSQINLKMSIILLHGRTCLPMDSWDVPERMKFSSPSWPMNGILSLSRTAIKINSSRALVKTNKCRWFFEHNKSLSSLHCRRLMKFHRWILFTFLKILFFLK